MILMKFSFLPDILGWTGMMKGDGNVFTDET